MLCHNLVWLCYALLCCVVLRFALLCCATLCSAVLCYAMLCSDCPHLLKGCAWVLQGEGVSQVMQATMLCYNACYAMLSLLPCYAIRCYAVPACSMAVRGSSTVRV
jgi:hypothetical protein